MAGYDSAKEDQGFLRRTIEGAVTGVKSIFGRSPEQEAADEEKKLLGTWAKEIELAESFFSDFDKDGLRCVKAFLGEHDQGLGVQPKYALNLFHSNIETLTSIMYAKLPKVEADRRYADPNDDEARVAAMIATRLLENDMNDPADKLAGVLKNALQDRLVPGLGSARVRYCMTEKELPRPEGTPEEVPPEKVKDEEWCDIEYVHWRDILWSPCRTPSELRWKAFRVYMTKAEVTARFGEQASNYVSYATRGPKLDPSEGKTTDQSMHQDVAQAEIWEIWDKASHRVYWYCKGCVKFLDVQEDPMELDGFFPDAPAMVANAATIKYLPKPDYLMAEGLYQEINELETRIGLLTKACKAVGVYPANATEIQRLLTEGCENEMLAVENWAMFADKGGLKGQIDYFPIKEVAETLQILVIQQQQRIQQLYQVTGMSDIIRGQASTQGVTATEQRIKAQFASTRMQSFQDEFANFAAELLNRKLQLVRKYYDPERIKRLSNIMRTPDAALADAAIALLQNENEFDCRIAVRAETMAQIDFEALKTERSEFMGAVASFLQAAAPLLEQKPEAAPFLMELLKFNLAGMKGAKEMEGVFDQGIAAMQQAEQAKAAQPPEPSPEEKAQMLKNEGAVQVAQAKAQGDQATAQTEAQIAQQEHEAEMARMQQEMAMEREEHALKMKELEAKIMMMFAKLGFEQESQQMELAGQQQEHALDAEAQARGIEHDERRMDMEEEHAEASFERESEQSDERFQQESRHAEAAARREARSGRGEGDKE